MGLISNIEQAIRYLVSGAMLVAVWLLALADPGTPIRWAEKNTLLAVSVIAVTGFLGYTLYRTSCWLLVDRIAWSFRWSAPAIALSSADGHGYARPYAEFVRWRQSADVPERVSSYLFSRWAKSHLVLMSALAVGAALVFRQDSSFVAKNLILTSVICGWCAVVAVYNVGFLLRVEHYLMRHDKIAREAYALWERSGRPIGRDSEFWLQAAHDLGLAK